jgi:hypothetical protein
MQDIRSLFARVRGYAQAVRPFEDQCDGTDQGAMLRAFPN